MSLLAHVPTSRDRGIPRRCHSARTACVPDEQGAREKRESLPIHTHRPNRKCGDLAVATARWKPCRACAARAGCMRAPCSGTYPRSGARRSVVSAGLTSSRERGRCEGGAASDSLKADEMHERRML
eukprot:153047-Chlamydomonas_euryale.AAC.12